MTEPIHLPAVSPYGGGRSSSGELPSRRARRQNPPATAMTPAAELSREVEHENSASSMSQSEQPGQHVDLQA
ncbi:MAG: hypothetical protein RMJ19_00105 [Gemmatales bacterium]|nr:hypothetical protein [Gemmatales bacterium]MDW8174047.1 hypothetical protein [Gemmatales bacterium]